MTSKLVVNTIEADTGISSVSFASSISMSSTSKFHFSNAGIDIGADTNINRPAAGVLGFNINGGEKVRITSTGEVGINVTPSNGQMLAITGRSGYDDIVQITADGTNMGARINLTNTGNGVSRINATNNSLALQTGGNERLRIASDGKVSIGNLTSPDSLLHIHNGSAGSIAASSAANLTIESDGSYNVLQFLSPHTAEQQIRFGDNSDNGAGYIAYNHGSDYLGIGVGGPERARITSGGQLLINTTTAVRALTIKDPGQMHLESTSTGNWVGTSLKGSSGTNNYNAYYGILDSDGRFFIDNGSNGDDFVITQTGQITKPNHCCFEVKLNGDQAFNSASRFKINFNYVANQQGTSFDTSNNRFTAPVTGYYQFNVGVYSYYSTYMEIDGRCNGASTGAKTYRPTTRYSDGTDRNPGASMMASWIVKLSTNDYYEIYCYVVSSSGTRNIYSDINRTPTWWSGFLVA